MSNNYRWKDRYFNHLGVNLVDSLTRKKIYISNLGLKSGNGSKNNPYPILSSHGKMDHTLKSTYILSSGKFPELTLYGYNTYGSPDICEVFGSGCKDTTVEYIQNQENYSLRIFDMTILKAATRVYGSINLYHKCILKSIIGAKDSSNSCLFDNVNVILNRNINKNNSFVNSNVDISYIGQLALAGNSDVHIPTAMLSSTSASTYLAFSNCRFRIGTMTEYERLVGETEEELRNSFVQLCIKGGISESSIPKGSELGDVNLPMYRWVFSNDDNKHGYVIKDSIIDKFQQRRLVRFGWNSEPVLPIEITTDSRKINSLSSTLDKNILIDDESKSIRLAQDMDISDIKEKGQQTARIKSNIIWLGEGKQKVSSVNITHNLATEYGVMIDSDPSIVPIERNTIQEGEMYLIRTKLPAAETITYNNTTYSTALSANNNVFIGVKDVTNWEGSENIVVYRVTDLAISNTIRMRIVDTIPDNEVKTIEKDVWYFVEPLNSSNPSGHVVYNGAEYPYWGSFKGEDITSYTISGDCRLRRCWKDGFTNDNQSDSTFWTDKQKPIWFDVAPNDMRCLLKNNNPLSVEMSYDKNLGTYITSGHPDFYSYLSSENGVIPPAYDITGKYMQIEIIISTLNPM